MEGRRGSAPHHEAVDGHDGGLRACAGQARQRRVAGVAPPYHAARQVPDGLQRLSSTWRAQLHTQRVRVRRRRYVVVRRVAAVRIARRRGWQQRPAGVDGNRVARVGRSRRLRPSRLLLSSRRLLQLPRRLVRGVQPASVPPPTHTPSGSVSVRAFVRPSARGFRQASERGQGASTGCGRRSYRRARASAAACRRA